MSERRYEIFGLPSEGQTSLKNANSSKAYRDFYYPGAIIGAFFRHATICALFYIFYTFIHVCIRFLTTRNKLPRWIKTLHWVIVGVLVMTAIIDWAFFIQKMMAQKARSTGHSNGSMVSITNRMLDIQLAVSIIRWLPSVEILAWTIYVFTKTIKTRSKIRVGARFTNSCRSKGFSVTKQMADTLILSPFRRRILLRTEHDVGYLLYRPLCHYKHSSNCHLWRRSHPDYLHLSDLSRDSAILC